MIMHVSIEMHNVVREWDASTESLHTIDSQWTFLQSGKNCAFRWFQITLYPVKRSRQVETIVKVLCLQGRRVVQLWAARLSGALFPYSLLL
jgi:hypothetical protein